MFESLSRPAAESDSAVFTGVLERTQLSVAAPDDEH